MLTADQVVLAASALGTQRLLHRMKDEGHLPGLSDRLGHLSRTNSESILGAIAPDATVDYSQGVAITSSFHPDEHTHIEPVRYGKGSNVMSLLQTVLTDGDGRPALADLAARRCGRRRRHVLDLYDMQALVRAHRDRAGDAEPRQLDHRVHQARPASAAGVLTSRQGHGEPNPTWIPVANEAVRRMAEIMGGTAGGSIGEPFNMPLTAHFIGGCTIGDSPETGVVDAYQRVYGHPGLHVADGSAISANLGVNPSLTITAQAERAMAFWPNKGEADPRPAAGRGVPADRAGRARPTRPSRRRAPARCGCRSSRSPDPHAVTVTACRRRR